MTHQFPEPSYLKAHWTWPFLEMTHSKPTENSPNWSSSKTLNSSLRDVKRSLTWKKVIKSIVNDEVTFWPLAVTSISNNPSFHLWRWLASETTPHSNFQHGEHMYCSTTFMSRSSINALWRPNELGVQCNINMSAGWPGKHLWLIHRINFKIPTSNSKAITPRNESI